jgi:hypothetical protein
MATKTDVFLKRFNELLFTYSKQKTRSNILAQYTANEISNQHTNNIVLMLFHFGNVRENLLAQKVFIENQKLGYVELTPNRIKAEKLANKYYYNLRDNKNESSIKKSKTMATKKPATPAQLAARAKFTQMVKEKAAAKKKGLNRAASTTGTRLCVRKNADGSTTSYSAGGDSRPCPYGGNLNDFAALNGAKAPAKRKRSVTAKKLCRMVIDQPGINKRTGQLLKGWHYVKGKPAKVTAKKKTTTKKVATKKPAAKKTTTRKPAKKRTKFLGIF